MPLFVNRRLRNPVQTIGKLVDKKLGIPYYYKELTAIAAEESGLDKEFISKLDQNDDVIHDLYLTTAPIKYAIEAQEKVIKKIASKGSCVIVGRAADYVLRDDKNVLRIFIYADEDTRTKNIMEMYGDSKEEAKKNMKKSDKNRANYYNLISGSTFGSVENYDLCIDSSIGAEKTAEVICDYIAKKIRLSKENCSPFCFTKNYKKTLQIHFCFWYKLYQERNDENYENILCRFYPWRKK